VFQLDYMAQLIPEVDWFQKSKFIVFLSNILPTITLNWILSIVPQAFRKLSILKGYPTETQVESDVQKQYFEFLFIQMFLVITISSGISEVLYQIVRNLTSIPGLLASNVPKVSNFFFTFIIIQGLSNASGLLLQLDSLIMNSVILPVLSFNKTQTARSKFHQLTGIASFRWRSTYPIFTNIAAITIVYSTISPMILAFSTFAFSLFYMGFKYRLIYCDGNYSLRGIWLCFFERTVADLFFLFSNRSRV
jgi:hypothetical protein